MLCYYLLETYLTPDDAQWIGAYWTGYLVFAVFFLLILPFLVMFPKKLPLKGLCNIHIFMFFKKCRI